MSDRFDDIREFYAHVDQHLAALDAEILRRSRPASEGEAPNSCGTCFECCRYSFYLSRCEFEYLEDHVRRATGSSPAEWVTCNSRQDDPRREVAWADHERCAFWRDGIGCVGYEARPLACRTLGPMLPSHSKLPEWCIYSHPEIYTTCEALPHWSEYVQILRAHYPSPPGYFRPAPLSSSPPGADSEREWSSGTGHEA